MATANITKFVFESQSNTIRLLPQNYCVIIKRDNRWVMDCDVAVDTNIAVSVFTEMHTQHNVRYGSGQEIVRYLNEFCLS